MIEHAGKYRHWISSLVAGFLIVVHACLAEAALTDESAGIDFSVKGTARSYPLGGVAEAEAGLYQTIWGRANGNNPWYGYGRIFIGGGGVPQYSEGSWGAELFPLSFFGVRMKSTAFQNHDDYEDYDCLEAICRGEFRDTRYEGIFKFAVGRLFLLLNFASVESEMKRSSPSALVGTATEIYVHPSIGLHLLSGEVTKWTDGRAVVGYRITDGLFVSAMYTRQELEDENSAVNDADDLSQTLTGNIHFVGKNFHVLIGAGEFHSDLVGRDTTVIGSVVWNIVPSPEL